MATFTWFNGNNGIWSYQDSNLYDLTDMTNSLYAGDYNGNDGAYDPDSHAYRFEATVSGGQLHTIQKGPNAGDVVYKAGTITAISYYDDSHNLLMTITGLSVDAASFHTLSSQGVFMWDYIAKGTNKWVGSDDSASINGWDGDDITTGHGNDNVLAKGGDDFISDKGGTDTYDGGNGWDTVNYDNWQWYSGGVVSGIVANLGKGTIKGPDGNIDKVISIEAVRGTFLADKITGDGNDNNFFGLQGNDTFNGKTGWDTIHYNRDARRGGTDGVIVDLGNGTATDGFGMTDTFKGIEAAIGTDTDDTLIDSTGDNYLEGRDGDDIFKLSGGNDDVDGGAGADDFQFYGAFGDDLIYDFSQGDGDIITIEGPASFAALTITQNGSDTEIAYNGNTITLENFTATNLGAGDFVFV